MYAFVRIAFCIYSSLINYLRKQNAIAFAIYINNE